MSIVTYNDRSIRNISAIPGAAKSLTHIKTLTASSSSTLSFVDGSSDVVLDSTYPIYLFKYVNIHPATNNTHLMVNFRDGGSSYDATKTTTVFYSYHDESDSEANVIYSTGSDLAQSTSAQRLTGGTGNGADESASGTLHLFNPSSTTFVKHFIGNSSTYNHSNYNNGWYSSGYCNVTAAIDAVQFSMSSGNIDSGTIKLYGIKDS
tara:strand:- start:555 stop:1172 length:618 start_codon:yes stop_codon:yes gene_type:complete